MQGHGVDDRLVRQIHALKFESMAGWCGQNRKGDIFARVESAASEAG